MLSDPQTVTVDGAPKVMPRVETNGRKSIYRLSDETYTLTISHTPTRDRVRSMARLDHKAVVPDPLTAVNDFETVSWYIVLDRPLAGFSAAFLEDLKQGLFTWLDDTISAKLVGQES